MKYRLYLSKLLALAICFFIAGNAVAQLAVTPNQTAATLINKLAGDNVTIINPALNCTGAHNGSFTATSTNLGIGEGIILATGTATSLSGPHNMGVGITALSPGDADLSALINRVTKDACILEFDFIPDIDTVSTMRFEYVFGSEEYPEFNCDNFNDVFGFLLTASGSTVPLNIALVPNTNIPVAINSINNGIPAGPLVNCTSMGPGSPFTQYYVDNAALNGQTITLDGFTTVLQAKAMVYPCDTYHMKLGIANAVDDGFQSAVFLKANSFSVDTVVLNLDGIVTSDNGYLVEGCTPAEIRASRSTAASTRKKICLSYGGTATNGIDYTFLPDTLIIPPYSTTGSIPLIPIQDNLPEGVETIIIRRLSCCTQVPMDSVVLKIRDSLFLDMITPDTVVCQGDVIYPHVLGDTAFSYQWTSSPTIPIGNSTDSIASAAVNQKTVFTVEATFKSCPSVKASFTADVEPYPIVSISPTDTTVCLDDSMRIKTLVLPANFPNYSYNWSPGTNLSSATVPQPKFFSNNYSDYVYTLTVKTPAGCKDEATTTIHTREPINFTLKSIDATYCAGETIPLSATGKPEYTYTWTSNPPGNPIANSSALNTSAIADTTAVFKLTATYFECKPMSDSFTATVEPVPNVHVSPQDSMVCLRDSMVLNPNVEPSWFTQYNYAWFPSANLSDPNAAMPKFFSQALYDHHYSVTVKTPHGCTGSDDFIIRSKPPVYLEDITTDTVIKYGNNVQLYVTGAEYYQWMPVSTLDNSIIYNPLASPDEPTLYTVIGMNVHGCKDTAYVNVDIDYNTSELLPNAFTPNGDGRNDRFSIVNLRFKNLLEFRIYNRWGKLVFETTDPEMGWDGSFKGVPQPTETYFYIVRVSRPDGTIRTYKGDLTLVR